MEIEVREPDFNKWAHLSRADRPAASLSEVTAGDLDRSLRQREIRGPGGFADELRVVLAGATGAWGQLTIFREATSPYFSDADVQFVSSVAGLIADGLRRGLLLDGAHALDDGVGVVVLDPEDNVQLADAAPIAGSTRSGPATGPDPGCRWWCRRSPARRASSACCR